MYLSISEFKKIKIIIHNLVFLVNIIFCHCRQINILNIIREIVFCRPCVDIVEELILLFNNISIFTEITDNLCQLSSKFYIFLTLLFYLLLLILY